MIVLNDKLEKIEEIGYEATNFKQKMIADNPTFNEHSAPAHWYHPEEIHAENLANHIGKVVKEKNSKIINEKININAKTCMNLTGIVDINQNIDKINNHVNLVVNIFKDTYSLPEQINLEVNNEQYSGNTQGQSISLGRWHEDVFIHEFGHVLMNMISDDFNENVSSDIKMETLNVALNETFADMIVVITRNDMNYIQDLIDSVSGMPNEFFTKDDRYKLRAFNRADITSTEVENTKTAYEKLAVLKSYLGKKLEGMSFSEKIKYSKNVGALLGEYYKKKLDLQDLQEKDWTQINFEIMEFIDEKN